MSADHYAEYRSYKAQFDAVGIPWNKKGSPHKLWLRARYHLRRVPFRDIVSFTLRERMPQLAANVTQNNALLQRLMRK